MHIYTLAQGEDKYSAALLPVSQAGTSYLG